MSKTISKNARNRILVLEFMVPALIILTIFVFYPILKSIIMRFQNWHLTSSSKEHEWVGLKNYKDVFEISHFWQMIGTTLLYTFFSVAGKMVVGLGVALLSNKRFKCRSIARGIMLIPWAMPTVVVCNTILIATDPDYGILTALFKWLFQLTNLQIFSSTTSSLVAVIIVNIWKNFPFVSLMLLSVLERYWYGEGEFKFFIDDDTEYPTICGTGVEDYVGGAWGFYEKNDYGVVSRNETTYCTPYMGYPYHSCVSGTKEIYGYDGMPVHGLYRWHIVDPICFKKRLKVTVQQIGHNGDHLFERADDVATVAYWYQSTINQDFPPLPDKNYRLPR